MQIKGIKRIIDQNIISMKSIIKPYLMPSALNIKMDETKKHIFVFLCGFYQNLGDMALTYAQCEMLGKYFSDEYEIVTIASSSTYGAIKRIKKKVKDEDVITVLGGGNMDDIYYSLENARRFVIHSFPNNKIVLFPQTMAFSDTEYGHYRLKKTEHTYNKHKNLHIFAREKNSFICMKESFYNAKEIGLVPDMVLSIKPAIDKCKSRSGVLCVFRDDYEKGSVSKNKNEIIEFLEKNYTVSYTDTTDVSKEECKEGNIRRTLIKFWELLASKELVVTDRLHCMIFCVITNTPCIVFDNSNHKISGIYDEWLKDVEYIRFIAEYHNKVFKQYCNELIGIKVENDINFDKEFLPLLKAVDIKCIS